jgi:hypothetical protein
VDTLSLDILNYLFISASKFKGFVRNSAVLPRAGIGIGECGEISARGTPQNGGATPLKLKSRPSGPRPAILLAA